MNKSKIQQKTFTIKNFQKWDHLIYKNAIAFQEKYGVYPNVLLACVDTFREIDTVANFIARNKIRDETIAANYTNPPQGNFANLSGFYTEDFEIDFAIEDSLEIGKMKLVFDSDPDWGGETAPTSQGSLPES
ncbi:MAG: hypothetical protein JJT78_13680 [Leptospira sp.]|nr:hypothetical protein [Leptospira sp.]